MQIAESEAIAPISEAGTITRVRAFVLENFLYMRPDFQLSDDDRLLEKGVVDSMGIAELIAFIEDEFGVHAAETEISEANFGSLGAIGAFVESKRSRAA